MAFCVAAWRVRHTTFYVFFYDTLQKYELFFVSLYTFFLQFKLVHSLSWSQEEKCLKKSKYLYLMIKFTKSTLRDFQQ